MKNPTSLADLAAIIRNVYDGINRNDIPGAIAAFDPDIEWIEPPEFPGGGTHRGLAAVRDHITRSRETWAEGTCEPERFIAAGERVVAFAYVRVRLKGHETWIEAPLADVFTFRAGRVREVRVFPERRDALKWAGVDGAEVD